MLVSESRHPDQFTSSRITVLRGRGANAFAFVALALQLLIAWRLRLIAWPEVTTPGYLVARGMVLYRDIKFVQTPGLMGLLGAAFAFLGVTAGTVRFFGIAWPLAAHAALLRQTNGFSLSERVWASAFFVSNFYAWGGNSIWPSVSIAAIALPIADALGRDRVRRAGLWIGVAILFKQTAAFLLAATLIRFAASRRYREIPSLVFWSSLPYALAGLALTALGAGAAFLRWTLLIPFRLHGEIAMAPTLFFSMAAIAAFIPLLFEAALERPGDYAVSARWHLLVATGLFLLAYPRFHPMECLACLPCLAVGVVRFLHRGSRAWTRALAPILVAALTLPSAAVWVVGDRFDGKIVFWNDDPSIDALLERIESLPPSTPLVVDLWPNVLPRSGRMPPGRLYVHPWLPYLSMFDGVGDRIAAAAALQHAAVVSFSGPVATSGRHGPYVIERR